eukprot:SAG11_NODE_655_length_7909_cov_7.307298_10_plen_58_part_00
MYVLYYSRQIYQVPLPKYLGTTLLNLLRELIYPSLLYFACVLSQPVVQYSGVLIDKM